MQEIDLLILGAGWTSTFLVPLLKQHNLTHATTTRDGRNNSIPFRYDPSLTDPSYFSVLPSALTILITFPLTSAEQTHQLTTFYKQTHTRVAEKVRFIQLGSTGIWQPPSPSSSTPTTTTTTTATTTTSNPSPTKELWITRHSAYNTSNARAIAEDALLALGGCVLNLSGLWGGTRDPKSWVDRVADSKEKVRGKSSLHMIHGVDVARGIVAVIENWDTGGAGGQRWMLTDGFVYDWWALFVGWADVGGGEEKEDGAEKIGEPSRQSKWVYELMEEEGVRALPRSMEALGRCYDSREFWKTFGLTPLKSRI